MIVAWSLLLAASGGAPTELDTFLARRDETSSYRVEERSAKGFRARFVSQTWKGQPWQHTLSVRYPDVRSKSDLAILVVTGDGPRDGDRMLIEAISRASGLPVATLYDIPNQPISGLREDDLIAHTFVKYFETGDASWPLLFPMTRAAIRSLGVIRAAAEVDQVKIRRFVVTGASKRGWTAWLTAAARDRRIVGIAPMVYDNLDIPGQMKHQLSSWGKYSPMIGDYTERGLQQQLDSERGRTLVRMVDPFAYRERIKVPTLIVNGANDPYWTVDALSLYWDRLSMPLRASIVPNAGHNLGDGRQAIEALSAFAVAQSERRQLPRPEARWGTTENSKTELRLTCRGPWIAEAAIWVADSRDRNFADKKWRVLQTVPTQGGRLDRRITVPIPADGFTAVLPEFRYKDRARSFRLSLPVRVLGG